MEGQIECWQRFLHDYPTTTFRDEIEGNIRHLDKFLLETDPVRKREQRDSERYLRAVRLSQKLPPQDEIDLWEQFLEEGPDTLYRKEILQRLQRLTAKETPRATRTTVAAPMPSTQPVTNSPLSPRLPFKSEQKAVLLSTFPGLLVPGIGHWYAEEYVLAGILTGVRVGGLALGIPGIIKNNSAMIIVGAILAGASYLIDIADAPFAVNRFNEALEEKSTSRSDGLDLNLALSFTF